MLQNVYRYKHARRDRHTKPHLHWHCICYTETALEPVQWKLLNWIKDLQFWGSKKVGFCLVMKLLLLSMQLKTGSSVIYDFVLAKGLSQHYKGLLAIEIPLLVFTDLNHLISSLWELKFHLNHCLRFFFLCQKCYITPELYWTINLWF